MQYTLFLFAAFLAGCSNPTTPAEADPCVALSESNCLSSTTCTLIQAATAGPYSCRAAADACEEGFRQTIDTANDCEAESGCAFDPGECYCPPGVTCICGGGPPPQCQVAP